MNFRNLKTKVIAPTLLLIPMACMHLGDDHHGHDHFLGYSTHAPASGTTIGGSTAIRYDSMTAQEATTTQPQGEKGG